MSLDLDSVRERNARAVEYLKESAPRYSDPERGHRAAWLMAVTFTPALLDAYEDLTSEAERMRLAWTSARGRAAAYADELDETRTELAELSKAYLEVCQSLQVLRGDTP